MSCTCPSGYIFNGSECTSAQTITATKVVNNTPITRTPYHAYGTLGTKVYNGINYTFGSTVISGPSAVPFWQTSTDTGLYPHTQAGQLMNGPVNRMGIWGANSFTYPSGPNAGTTVILNNYLLGGTLAGGGTGVYNLEPTLSWIGFDYCITVSQTQTYYIGVAGDDKWRVSIDGNIVLNSDTAISNSLDVFNYFHIFPVVISAGTHLLRLEGYNFRDNVAPPNVCAATFAAEIYDLSNLEGYPTAAAYLASQNSYTANLLKKIVFSTGGYDGVPKTGFTSTLFSCPSGFNISSYDCNSTNAFCSRILTVPCLTPTPTTTPTPTLTPTPTSIPISIYVSGCCDGKIYRLLSGVGQPIGSVIRVGPFNFCYTVISEPKLPTTNVLNDNLGVMIVKDGCYDLSCQPCPSSTPTPTPTQTPGNTPTPTPAPNPPPIPAAGSVGDECKIITIQDFAISCSGTNPTNYSSLDGSLTAVVSGGTSPYYYLWKSPSGNYYNSKTITNLPSGDYTLTVYDYFRDFSATTICTITGPKDCEFDASYVEFIVPTQTPTPTPTPTTPICQRPLIISNKAFYSYLYWDNNTQPPLNFIGSFSDACLAASIYKGQTPADPVSFQGLFCDYTPSFTVGATVYNWERPFATGCELLTTGYYVTDVTTSEITYVVNGIIQNIVYCVPVTPTPTPSITPTNTVTPSITPTNTVTPTVTRTSFPTPTPTSSQNAPPPTYKYYNATQYGCSNCGIINTNIVVSVQNPGILVIGKYYYFSSGNMSFYITSGPIEATPASQPILDANTQSNSCNDACTGNWLP